MMFREESASCASSVMSTTGVCGARNAHDFLPEDEAAGLPASTRGELTGVDRRLFFFELRSSGAASSQAELPCASLFSGCGAACRHVSLLSATRPYLTALKAVMRP